MTPQEFFYFQIGVALFLVILFVTIKKKAPPPTPLDLKEESHRHSLAAVDTKPAAPNPYRNYKKPIASVPVRKAKELNVMFMYNSHSWDAYEVLGIPAGSSLEEVQRAYIKMVEQSKPESVEFLTTAFEAIKKKLI